MFYFCHVIGLRMSKVTFGASLVARLVRNLPSMQETWVQETPEEGNGSPLQYSCLENPMDRGAWQVTVHIGVTRVRHDLATTPPPPPKRLLTKADAFTLAGCV